MTSEQLIEQLVTTAADHGNAVTAGSVGTVALCERLNEVPEPRVRLVCFHDAGGAAIMFAPFTSLKALGVEVHTVSHVRNGVPDAATAARYLREATAYARSLPPGPCVLLGHSLGALLAWRVAQELVTDGDHAPAVLLVSSSAAPDERSDAFTAEELDGSFRRVFGERADAAVNLRADFGSDMRLWQELRTRHQRPLDIPIAAYRGDRDHVVSSAQMERWRELTAREFTLTHLPGDHFFPADAESRQWLMDDIGRLLASGRFDGHRNDQRPTK